MSDDPDRIVPLRFDLSDLVRQSVATLYSHLVTRPTGKALRLGIESQISELGAVCVTTLDFSEVVVLDYSCADETVAKLIQRFQREDRPADAYFIARGLDDRHLQAVEAVLERHALAMVAELPGGGTTLLGHATALERSTWAAVESLGHSDPGVVAERVDVTETVAIGTLDALFRRRVMVRRDIPRTYYALSTLGGR